MELSAWIKFDFNVADKTIERMKYVPKAKIIGIIKYFIVAFLWYVTSSDNLIETMVTWQT